MNLVSAKRGTITRKLEQEYEVQMLLKTDLAHQQALLDCLKSHHPYQTPELLVLPVTHGDNDYDQRNDAVSHER